MTQKEKLYKIMDDFDVMSVPTENFRHSLADYLIANNVVVLPFAIGEKFFYSDKGKVFSEKVAFVTYDGNFTVYDSHGIDYDPSDLFRMREEAEEFLRREKANG